MQLWNHPLWIVPELCLCISIVGFARAPYEPHVMRLHLVPTVRGEVQLHSPVFTGITHCNDAFCVCENDHPETREWDVLSWTSHTAQTVPSTHPNVCVDPSAWMTRYHGPRWSSLKQSSFHSLRDTSKRNNLCYPNDKQITAIVNWHVFSRSQAANLPFRTQRPYFKAWLLPSHQCHKYCRVWPKFAFHLHHTV